MKKELKQKFINLAKNLDLDLFILFGSRANNTHKEDSDWDFAYLKNNFTYKEYEQLYNKLMDILNSENIDLINLDETDNLVLTNEIFKNGECIYEKQKGLFDLNEANSWFNFVFYKDSIDIQNKNLKNELHNI